VLGIELSDRHRRTEAAVVTASALVDVVVAADGARKIEVGAFIGGHKRGAELGARRVRAGAIFGAAEVLGLPQPDAALRRTI